MPVSVGATQRFVFTDQWLKMQESVDQLHFYLLASLVNHANRILIEMMEIITHPNHMLISCKPSRHNTSEDYVFAELAV